MELYLCIILHYEIALGAIQSEIEFYQEYKNQSSEAIEQD